MNTKPVAYLILHVRAPGLVSMIKNGQRQFPGFFASHGGNGLANWQTIAAQLAPYGRKFWMTETSGHNADWRGGLALAENMHDTLVGGRASAYLYWQISEPNSPRMTLMAAGDFTPKTQAARHFIRLVRPGAQRVDVSGDFGLTSNAPPRRTNLLETSKVLDKILREGKELNRRAGPM